MWLFKQIGIEYDRDDRKLGLSKYNILKLYNLALNGILNFFNETINCNTFFRNFYFFNHDFA